MTPKQVELVETSFKAFVPVAYQTTEDFYESLFRVSPHLRGLFPKDMQGLRKKLVETLTYVVNGLRYPDALLPVVRDLGRRHKGFRVEPGYYALVSAALIESMERAMGTAFGPEVKQAWKACITFLATEMITAGEAA
ncbi:globin domain-containing protein [Roseicyclus mahoneyensis]|uniref:Hemoglobin-like flavoprotein n=1 Tax=Roseicyclus mahoneyensis TaxID=164332 RepID=A0A316GL17_9RHOB|nr:globin domain-containing protein [Roseicyclus mahoneyensis]PWK60898.1 hemoglobin-like flavoprotein [Roseicyclus mahoneyensis]